MFNKPRLLTPGPTPLPESIRLILARDMIHHRKAAFKEAMAETGDLLRRLFGTAQPVLPLTCSGTGAMTAAVHGLFNPGESVVVVDAGKFGERWRRIAEVRGLRVISVATEWGRPIDVAEVEATLHAHPEACGLLVQASETSTGVLHPVEEIGRLTCTRNVLLVVDGISAVGISPCPMDAWNIDCLLTGSQKGLMLPPGLALTALSERAWAKAESVPASCFYFDLPGERRQVLQGQTLFTSPVAHILALREGLRLLLQDGSTDAVFRKQWALTQMARTGAEAMGLSLFAPAGYTWGLTSIRLPAGVDGTAVLSAAAAEYGVIMAGGQDHLKGKIIRMGHMGWVDWGDLAAGLHALAGSLRAAGGFTASRDYLETALNAYRTALAGEPGRPVAGIRS